MSFRVFAVHIIARWNTSTKTPLGVASFELLFFDVLRRL